MSVKKRKSKKNSSLSRALKDMPSLIMQEREAQQSEQTQQQRPKRVPVYESNPQSTRWLWTGVVIVMLAIIGLWGLSMSSLFFDNKHTTDPSERLLLDSKYEINSIISTFQEQEKRFVATTTSTTDIEETTEKNETDTHATSTLSETLQQLFASSTSSTTTTEQ